MLVTTTNNYSTLIRVLIVIGTRPETIKMIPVIKALQDSKKFRPVIIGTGQHSDMVKDLISRAGIRLDADLHVGLKTNTEGPSLNRIFARVLEGIDRIWEKQTIPSDFQSDGRRQPRNAQVCLVHGDTTSAAAGALAAFNLQIPVMHVEAGLRTANIMEPFPEEGNRQIISRIAAMHFAPTATSKSNLIREGIDPDRIVVTGNTAIDTLDWALGESVVMSSELTFLSTCDEPLVIVTAHRRENIKSGLQRIATAVKMLATRNFRTNFVLPLHPNPKVRQAFKKELSGIENVFLIEPLEYLEFVHLAAKAKLIITDSGGIQEEAPSLGVPVLVTREVTERGEGMHAGTLKLVGTDIEEIVSQSQLVLDSEIDRARLAKLNPYGDGLASKRITQTLANIFSDGPAPEEFNSKHLKQSFLRFMGRN